MKRKTLSLIAASVLLSAATVFCVTYICVWRQFDERLGNLEEKTEGFEKLAEINSYIDDYYVADYDESRLADGAAAGIISALPDGWSSYMSAEQYELYMSDEAEKYVGIGVRCTYESDGGFLKITEVMTDSPAQKSGLKFGDQISGVNGESVAELGYEGAVNKVRGGEGTTVRLTVYTPGDAKERDIDVMRAVVSDTEVIYEMMDGDIGYIIIKSFSSGVDTLFLSALDTLVNQGAKGIIFDVRLNSGGYMNVLANMLDPLMGEGTIIETHDKNGLISTLESDSEELNIPMAVLVHEYSFSAAEFFAAALQETGKAMVIGTKTVGKGYAQERIELSDGSAIMLSTKEYYTPKGKSLQGVGIEPDYDVQLTYQQLVNLRCLSREEDPQIHKAYEMITELIQ